MTFGQPKVTNKQGGKDFAGAPYLRVINDQDAVAQAPPSNLVYDLSGAYAHFGPEIALRAGGQWSYSATHVRRDYLAGDNWKRLDLENATDHQIRNYIDRIEAVK